MQHRRSSFYFCLCFLIRTFRGLSIVFGLATSREASKVTSLREFRSNILEYFFASHSFHENFLYLKKLLQLPVIIWESFPFQPHSNLSKMQSFSYREHSLERKYSWTQKVLAYNVLIIRKLPSYCVCFDWFRLHVQIPDFNRQIIPANRVSQV